MLAELLAGYEGYKVHLDGYNQLSYPTGETESNRKEIIYYQGTDLQTARYNDWKAHFVVQNAGWSGPKEESNAPLLINLRRAPYEKAAEDSAMYIKWTGTKMWAFGPATRLVQNHLATFAEYPPRGPEIGNQDHVEEQVSSEGGVSQ